MMCAKPVGGTKSGKYFHIDMAVNLNIIIIIKSFFFQVLTSRSGPSCLHSLIVYFLFAFLFPLYSLFVLSRPAVDAVHVE